MKQQISILFFLLSLINGVYCQDCIQRSFHDGFIQEFQQLCSDSNSNQYVVGTVSGSSWSNCEAFNIRKISKEGEVLWIFNADQTFGEISSFLGFELNGPDLDCWIIGQYGVDILGGGKVFKVSLDTLNGSINATDTLFEEDYGSLGIYAKGRSRIAFGFNQTEVSVIDLSGNVLWNTSCSYGSGIYNSSAVFVGDSLFLNGNLNDTAIVSSISSNGCQFLSYGVGKQESDTSLLIQNSTGYFRYSILQHILYPIAIPEGFQKYLGSNGERWMFSRSEYDTEGFPITTTLYQTDHDFNILDSFPNENGNVLLNKAFWVNNKIMVVGSVNVGRTLGYSGYSIGYFASSYIREFDVNLIPCPVIDDLEILEIALDSATFKNPNGGAPTIWQCNSYLSFRLKNSGSVPLKNFKATACTIQGGLISWYCVYPMDKVDFSGFDLMPGEDQWFSFGIVHSPAPLQINNGSIVLDYKVYVTAPNERIDGDFQNNKYTQSYFFTNVGFDELGFQSISVYPNPNQGMVNISNLKLSSSKVIVELSDVMGQLVYSDGFPGNVSCLSLALDFLPDGIYFLTISNTEQTSAPVKLVIERN